MTELEQMKPFYSILELSDLIDDLPDRVVTALIASGVTIFRDGKPCDDSDLAPLKVQRTFHIDANGLSRTANLLVASESLPDLWKQALKRTDMEQSKASTFVLADDLTRHLSDKSDTPKSEVAEFVWQVVGMSDRLSVYEVGSGMPLQLDNEGSCNLLASRLEEVWSKTRDIDFVFRDLAFSPSDAEAVCRLFEVRKTSGTISKWKTISPDYLTKQALPNSEERKSIAGATFKRLEAAIDSFDPSSPPRSKKAFMGTLEKIGCDAREQEVFAKIVAENFSHSWRS